MRSKPLFTLMAAVAFTAVSPWRAPAAETPSPERQMSLVDCITTALERNLDIQIERYNPLIADAALRMAYGDYDPQVRMSASHSFNQDPGGRDAQAREYLGRVTDSDTFQASLSGLLPSGMSYNISSFAQDTYGREPFADLTGPTPIVGVRGFENSRANFMMGELRQPLLRNFWIDGTRLNIRLRTKDLRITDLNLRLQLINTVSAVEQAYYDLIASRENVRSAEIALTLAQKLYQENKKRVEVGALAELDERQAQAQMAASEAALIEARRSVDFTQNVLKNLLSDRFEEWHTVTIVPAESLQALPVDLDVNEAWNTAFKMRPDLQVSAIELEKYELNIRYSRNQLYPQLDVFGAIGWQGSGSEFSDSLGQVYDGSAPLHSYGGQLTFPLSNRRARESYRSSKDQRAQAELRMRQLRQQVMVGVHDAVQQAQASFQRVGATRAAREFAQDALAAEEKKLANGKSTSFEVLRLQRDLTQARFDETRALTDYNKAMATVRQREGSTLLKFNLETVSGTPSGQVERWEGDKDFLLWPRSPR